MLEDELFELEFEGELEAVLVGLEVVGGRVASPLICGLLDAVVPRVEAL